MYSISLSRSVCWCCFWWWFSRCSSCVLPHPTAFVFVPFLRNTIQQRGRRVKNFDPFFTTSFHSPASSGTSPDLSFAIISLDVLGFQTGHIFAMWAAVQHSPQCDLLPSTITKIFLSLHMGMSGNSLNFALSGITWVKNQLAHQLYSESVKPPPPGRIRQIMPTHGLH